MIRSAASEELTRERIAGITLLRRPARLPGARPLVLLHGIGSNAASFAPLMTALPGTIDALAWDAPGYGTSDPVDAARPAPRDYAEALHRMIAALRLRDTVIAGHSLGTLFAAAYAAAHPDAVSALVLMSPALGYRVPAGGALPAGVQGRIDEIRSLGPAAFAARRAPRLVHAPESRPETTSAVKRAMAAVQVDGYVQAVHALGAGDLLADAARINVPTLVVVGAEDQITPPANAQRLRDTLPHATGYSEIPETGHALPQERPEALATMIAQFLEQHADV